MCGICGFTGEVINRDDVIERMAKVITHRGPDSSGFYKEPDSRSEPHGWGIPSLPSAEQRSSSAVKFPRR